MKEGQQLHVINDLDRVKKLQDLFGLGPCEASCTSMVGQMVEVLGISLGQYGGYYVSVRLPESSSEDHLAPPCLTELWCGKAAMVLPNLGMMVAVVLFLYVNILGCFEIMHQQFRQQQVLESLGNNSAQLFRMIVSGRAARHLTHVHYGPNSRLRWTAFKYCPWIDLLCLLLVYVALAFRRTWRMFYNPVVTATTCLACILCWRFGLWVFCVIKYCQRAAAEQTFDIAFCALSDIDSVCVIYRRFCYWFCNIGNVGQGRPPLQMNTAYRKPMVLVRSQLLSHHSDPENDESPIVGWSLKMCYGEWHQKKPHDCGGLVCTSHGIPSGPSPDPRPAMLAHGSQTSGPLPL